MKNSTLKKYFTFILLMGEMFSFTAAEAQCKKNEVLMCFHAPWYLTTLCIPEHKIAHYESLGWQICDLRSSETMPGATSPVAKVFPNPLGSFATMYFALDQSQKISLKVFDVNGRLVTTLADASFEEGDHEILWNTEGVNAGIYFLRLETANYSENLKLVVSK